MGFLEGKLVQVDPDAGKLTILKRGTFVGGQRIPVMLNSRKVPFIEVDLPNVGKTAFLIDTGCCGFRSGFLSKETFTELCRVNELRPLAGSKADVSVIDDPGASRTGVLAWQSIGWSRHSNLVYTENNSKTGSNGLGLGYLCRFKFTLDFHNWEIVLQKGEWFDRTSPANQAGVDLVTVEGIPTVAWVEPEGPAWKAGLRPGDRIMSLGGKDAQKLRLDEIGDELYWVRGGVTMNVVHAMEIEVHAISLMRSSARWPDGERAPADR